MMLVHWSLTRLKAFKPKSSAAIDWQGFWTSRSSLLISTGTTTTIHFLDEHQLVHCLNYGGYFWSSPSILMRLAPSRSRENNLPDKWTFRGGSNQYFYVWGHFQNWFQKEKFLHGVWLTWVSPFHCSSQLTSVHLVASLSSLFHICLNSIGVSLCLALLYCKLCLTEKKQCLLCWRHILYLNQQTKSLFVPPSSFFRFSPKPPYWLKCTRICSREFKCATHYSSLKAELSHFYLMGSIKSWIAFQKSLKTYTCVKIKSI